MTPPTHHPPDEALFDYAAGTADTALDLLTATHLALCPRCREVVRELEAVGARVLEDLPPAPLRDGALASMLERLEAAPGPEAPPAPGPTGTVLPRPLRDVTGPVESLPWRWLLPGIHHVQLPVQHNGLPVRLFKLAAGLKIPTHTHQGLERTLVLRGGFTDDEGQLSRGDVAFRDGSQDHHQVIDPGEPCLALVVADAPLVPRSFLAWVAQLVARA